MEGLQPAPWTQSPPPDEAPPRPQRRVRRGAPPPGGPPSPRRRRPTRETMARVGVAIPWIVFAVVIVALGGIPFAVAMIGISVIGMAEFFRMTRRFHPLPPVAFAATAGLVFAAYYGGQYQMLIVLVATFPLMFLLVAARGARHGVTAAVGITLLAVV